MQGYARAGGAVNDYTASNQPMWDISNTTTWVKGNHTFNFGANYRRWSLQRDTAADLLGELRELQHRLHRATRSRTSCSATTAAPPPSSPGPLPSRAQVGNPYEFNWMYFAPYIQDDWKVSSKLTLNLGLRYDYRNVPYETNNHMAWRNLDYAPGGLLVADESLAGEGVVDGAYYQEAGRRSPENPDRYKVFAPRLGFAYRPTDVREHGHPRRLRDLLRLGRGTRDRRRRGCLSVRQPQQLLADPRPDGAAARRPTSCSRASPGGGVATPGRQHLPRREPVSGAEEPQGPPVVSRRPAAALDGRPPRS